MLIDYIDRQSRAVSETPASAGSANNRATTAAAPTTAVNLTPMLDAYLRIQRGLNVDSLEGGRPTRARSPPRRESWAPLARQSRRRLGTSKRLARSPQRVRHLAKSATRSCVTRRKQA